MKIIEKKKLYLTLLAVAGIIALVISWLLSGAAPIHWSKKSGNIYEISSVDIIRTTVPVAPAVQKRITFKGKLNFRVFNISEDKVRAGFQFSPVKIKIGRERHKEVEDIYSKIFFADITPEGQFTGFYFNNEIAPDDEENIINTIKSFQFIITDRKSSNWDSEETDSHGTYRAAYSAAEGGVSKTKKEYLEEIERGGFVNKEGRIKIKQSELSVEYGSPVSWIKNASGKELLTFGQEGITYLKMSSMVSLKLLPFEPDKDLAIWQDGRTPGEYISQWEKLTKNMISLALLSDRKKLEEKIGRVSPEKYINNIFSMNKRFNSNAIGELLNYLKLYPEEAARILPAILLTGELNSHQRAMLVHALGRAGHRQAQKALVKIIEDPEFAKENRIQATIVFGDIKKPEEDSINSLWEAYEGKKNSPEKDISSTSILALGSIAGTLSRSIDQDDRANSDRIKKRIESDLNSDQDLNSKVALLHAAGNTEDRIDLGIIHICKGSCRVSSYPGIVGVKK